MTTSFANLSFRKNDWGQLVLTFADGAEHVGVEPVRCFPLTEPERWIAILDAEGREVLNLPSLDVLSPTAREVLRRELIEREFMPSIRKISSASAPNPPCQWIVETDRGATQFQLESEDEVRRLGKNSVVIADSHGIRYKIEDIGKLDSFSQRTIRRLI